MVPCTHQIIYTVPHFVSIYKIVAMMSSYTIPYNLLTYTVPFTLLLFVFGLGNSWPYHLFHSIHNQKAHYTKFASMSHVSPFSTSIMADMPVGGTTWMAIVVQDVGAVSGVVP